MIWKIKWKKGCEYDINKMTFFFNDEMEKIAAKMGDDSSDGGGDYDQDYDLSLWWLLL